MSQNRTREDRARNARQAKVLGATATEASQTAAAWGAAASQVATALWTARARLPDWHRPPLLV